jgi:hypothetical protein
VARSMERELEDAVGIAVNQQRQHHVGRILFIPTAVGVERES